MSHVTHYNDYMPELPEVEIICRGLQRSIVDKTVESLEVYERRSFPDTGIDANGGLVGATVVSLVRRGKLLIINLDNGFSLLVHLRMTGQLIFRSKNGDEEQQGGGYPNRSLIGALPDKSTRVVISFTDHARLFFNDQRKFGYLKLVVTDDVGKDEFFASLGPEPLADDFDVKRFTACLPCKSSRSIKSVLLDQSIIAGIGNIYADESLFLAGIRPDRSVNSLKRSEILKLFEGIQTSLWQSIADGGSTARNYVDSEGLRGEYLDLHAHVYNRTGKACPYCTSPIEKTRVAGRGTHYCPKCQK